MTDSVILLVFAAAILHATWNIIIKGGSNKLYETALKTLGGGLVALCAMIFLPFPRQEAWGFLALSSACHLGYYTSLAATYKLADLSVGYALMRGCAPMFTALALLLMGVALPVTGWLGIGLLCAGILSLALEQKHRDNASITSILYALRTALFIMGYTLSDGYGARNSGDAVAYTCLLNVINLFPLNIFLLWRDGRQFIGYARQRFHYGLAGGTASLISYGAATWAMTQAPIALVAALRETSIIFGLIFSIIFLGEKFSLHRALAILAVLAGVMTLRLG